MLNNIFAAISIIFVEPSELQYHGRSLKRVWYAVVFSIMLLFSCLQGMVSANEAPVMSVVIETTGEGMAPQNAANAAQARMMARRAALVDLARKATQETGAARAAVRTIYSEEFDGVKYVITADVQVYR